ncbi:unnamed protein product [Closterium sp. NIES-53]
MACRRASILPFPLLLLLLAHLPCGISAAANPPPSPGASAPEANTTPAPAAAAPVAVKLGFLLPVQERNLDIPLNLAREWGSAAQVALDVLSTRYTGFTIKPVFQAVECTADSAAVGAGALVKQGVAGVVGPACSEAAVGAAPVLARAGIPMVSFAATADALRNRTAYPSFFRTASTRASDDAISTLSVSPYPSPSPSQPLPLPLPYLVPHPLPPCRLQLRRSASGSSHSQRGKHSSSSSSLRHWLSAIPPPPSSIRHPPSVTVHMRTVLFLGFPFLFSLAPPFHPSYARSLQPLIPLPPFLSLPTYPCPPTLTAPNLPFPSPSFTPLYRRRPTPHRCIPPQVDQLQWKRLLVFHTAETYGEALAYDVSAGHCCVAALLHCPRTTMARGCQTSVHHVFVSLCVPRFPTFSHSRRGIFVTWFETSQHSRRGLVTSPLLSHQSSPLSSLTSPIPRPPLPIRFPPFPLPPRTPSPPPHFPQVAQEPQLKVRTVRIPHPPPADCSAYFPPAADDWMKGSEDMGVVLAVLPSTASCLWAAASKLNLLGYPWWYLGTDGVAALDLMDAAPQSGEEMLANHMLNELALAPSGADPSGEQPFAPFKAYWQQQSYAAFPGLLTFDSSPRFSSPRPFVPHLVDAVWAFHEAINKTVGEHGASLSAAHLLACFNDSPADCVSFPGATGHVHFDSDSGERSKVQASPRYSLMQFAGLPWMPVGEWVEQQQPRLNLTQETPLLRPADPAATAGGDMDATGESSSNRSSSSGRADSAAVSAPAQQSAANEPFSAAPLSESGSSSSSSGNGGTIAIAVVCSVMLVALLAIIGAMLWSKRQYLFVHEEPKHQMVADDADVARGGVHLL